MTNKITLIILLLSLIGHSQNTIGTISIEEGVYDAYTLATVHTESYLINNCGEIINQWTSDYLPGTSVYLLPNGNLLRPGRLDDGSTAPETGARQLPSDWFCPPHSPQRG